MKAVEFPLMCKFIHGAFSANSGGDYEFAKKVDCVGTRDAASATTVRQEWNRAEKWLKEFVGPVADSESDAMRLAFWLGCAAEDGHSVHSMGTGMAMPYRLLNRYY